MYPTQEKIAEARAKFVYEIVMANAFFYNETADAEREFEASTKKAEEAYYQRVGPSSDDSLPSPNRPAYGFRGLLESYSYDATNKDFKEVYAAIEEYNEAIAEPYAVYLKETAPAKTAYEKMRAAATSRFADVVTPPNVLKRALKSLGAGIYCIPNFFTKYHTKPTLTEKQLRKKAATLLGWDDPNVERSYESLYRKIWQLKGRERTSSTVNVGLDGFIDMSEMTPLQKLTVGHLMTLRELRPFKNPMYKIAHRDGERVILLPMKKAA